MVGDFLNEEITQECKNQTLSTENGKMKRLEFSTLFFSIASCPCRSPDSCLSGQALQQDMQKSNAIPQLWGMCFQPPLGQQQPLTRISRRVSHPPLPGQRWHRVYQPGVCTRWRNPGPTRGGERGSIHIQGQPAIVSQEGVNPGDPDLVSYCWLLWVKAFLAQFQGQWLEDDSCIPAAKE